MKKLGYIVAAIVAVGLAAPSIASAETVVIRHGDRDYDRGARAEYREHRDHGWRHHDRVVIIKHRHHHDEYWGASFDLEMAPYGAIFLCGYSPF